MQQKQLWRLIAVLLAFTCLHTQASTLTEYVNLCTAELELGAAPIPSMNCRDGVLFHPSQRSPGCTSECDPRNDYMSHKRVTDDVDAVLACRWSFDNSFLRAEMLVHNRKSGKTCFFEASQQGARTLPTVSPTVAAAAAAGTPAALYWEQPTQVGQTGCVNCHAAGAYIASADIAAALAKFGLLNDGHDVFLTNYQAVGDLVANYSSDGLTIQTLPFNSIIQNTSVVGCAQGCHYLHNNPYVGGTIASKAGLEIPGIAEVFFFIEQGQLMPPSTDTSAYRWINRDNPGSDGADIETFTASKNSFGVLSNCGVPTAIEAHAVGSNANFSAAEMATIPDKLNVFNAREGLICLSSDQPNGRPCNDYSIKYLCSDDSWSSVYNMDSPSFGGDYEPRSNHANVCNSKPGLTVVAIQATTTVNGVVRVVNGPNDRLAQLIPTGLICKSADQPNGQACSNYVVNYTACRPKTAAYIAKLKNAWANPPTFTNRFLTTTNTVNGAETRAQAENIQYSSQDWIIEIVSGTTVRLKDVWSGKYLTAANNNDQATVLVNNLDTAQARQKWVKETIAGSTEVRFKNVGSGRYLTVGNYTTDPYFAPMLSQTLSSQNWASQRWVLQ